MAARPPRTILGATGGVLLALTAAAVLTHQPWLAAVLAVLGAAMLAMAALEPRLKGPVSAGPQGFTFNLVEQVSEKGVEAGLSAEQFAAAIRHALVQPPSPQTISPDGIRSGEAVGTPTVASTAERIVRSVQVQDAAHLSDSIEVYWTRGDDSPGST